MELVGNEDDEARSYEVFSFVAVHQETDFEYKFRLCLAKRNKEIDITWADLAKILDCGNGGFLRKWFYGVYDYHCYLSGNENLQVANRILCISDLHIPFHLPIETYEKYKGKIDTLVLNGDIVDMQGISKFQKLYRISPMEELIEGRKFIIKLIEYLKPTKVIGINGNHEVRFGNYLAKNIDTDVLELMPNSPIELIFIDGFVHYDKRERCKIKYNSLQEVFPEIEFVYPDDWKYQIGDTIFCHPFAFSSVAMKTGIKAFNWFLENGYDFKNLIVAHTHKVGNYMISEKSIFESGCCMDIEKNNYTDGKLVQKSSCGYMYIEENKQGLAVKTKQELISRRYTNE